MLLWLLIQVGGKLCFRVNPEQGKIPYKTFILLASLCSLLLETTKMVETN